MSGIDKSCKSAQFGTSIDRSIPNAEVWDGEGDPPPGFGWKLSERTRREIEEIEQLARRSMADARNIRVD
jgi:hypothetical protein